MKKIEALLEWGGMKRDIAFLAVSALALVLSLALPDGLLPFDPAWAAIVLCGVPILLEAAVGLITAFDIKADVLVSMALVASVAIGEIFAAGEVAFIMQLGALLEEITVARAQAGIRHLVKLTPRTARRLIPGGEEVIPAQQVQVGDRLRVLPGETIPVDGVILQGQTSVNQAVMTGESLPVDLGPGDEVSSGTVNQFGSFDMEARRVGEDSTIQRLVRLVESADAGKAKIVRLADRWATWIVVTALTAALLTWLFTGRIIRAVTILVVFCPCALVLATPTAIMAAIGNATRHGFLVREGDALERLAQVKRVAFDKTGTLTYGKPQVSGVESLSKRWTGEKLYALAAGAEGRSEHPLGKAVVACYREKTGRTPPPCADFAMLPGRGVEARVEGHTVLAGNRALLEEAGLTLPQWPQAEGWLEKGSTLIYLSVDGEAAGFLALSDTPRPDAAQVVRAIQSAGAEPVLLTGDHAAAAKTLAEELGIPRFQADCLPQDKLDWIDASQQEGAGVCMVGDGINDAPALKRSLVGIAMGGVGSDIAVEAADIALVNDDIGQLPHLLRLSRKMMRTIKANMTFSMSLNFVAIVLAIRGDIDPVVGALVHNAGSVLVILNSARLLGMRTKG